MRYLIRCSAILTVVFVLAATLAGCGDSNVETIDRSEVARGQNTPASRPDIDAGATGAMGSIAGISWAIPAGWETGPERAMRAATYRVGAGPVKADCAVFYFGPGQGGGVQDNIDRWIGQFTQADGSDSQDKAKIEKQTIADLQVTTIDLAGTYTASMGGPMSAQKEDRSNYRMLGAIVEAPEGPVFFKLTGPEDVVNLALDDFNRLVKSVSKT